MVAGLGKFKLPKYICLYSEIFLAIAGRIVYLTEDTPDFERRLWGPSRSVSNSFYFEKKSTDYRCFSKR